MPKLTYAGTFDQPISLKVVRAEVKADARVIVPAGGMATFSEAQDARNFNIAATTAQYLDGPSVAKGEAAELKAGDLVVGLYIVQWLDSKGRKINCEFAFSYWNGTCWGKTGTYAYAMSHKGNSTFDDIWHWRLPTPSELAQHAPKEDGWIEWEGGECPVPCDTKVIVKFRDKSVEAADIQRADFWIWWHTTDDDDIIAYRLVPQ